MSSFQAIMSNVMNPEQHVNQTQWRKYCTKKVWHSGIRLERMGLVEGTSVTQVVLWWVGVRSGRVLGVMLWSPLAQRVLMGGLWWVSCFLARCDRSLLTNLHSTLWWCRECTFAAQLEHPGWLDCTTRFCGWPYTQHTYDQVFHSAWKEQACKVRNLLIFWGANKYYYLQDCKLEGYCIHSDTYHLCYFNHCGCPWRSSFGSHSHACFRYEMHDLWEASHMGFGILQNYGQSFSGMHWQD